MKIFARRLSLSRDERKSAEGWEGAEGEQDESRAEFNGARRELSAGRLLTRILGRADSSARRDIFDPQGARALARAQGRKTPRSWRG